jgi:pimeloyl-ACP methyl ester carboxylesterase
MGAGLALALASLLPGRFKIAGLALAVASMMAVVLLSRVLPWQFAATQRPFQWIPFFSFLHGSQSINVISFAGKFFLYGATLFLLVAAGLRLRLAVALLCVLLFATSFLQTFMVDRSGEISDAVLALLAGWIYAYMLRQDRGSAQTPSPGMRQAAELGG